MPEPTITRVLKARARGTILMRPPDNGGDGAPLLMGFHGYAESAQTMLARLASVPGAEAWTLCAVEGLHLFYARRGVDVVASWMTRKNRELAIVDNLAYVAKAVATARKVCGAGKGLVYAGFSQGVAMAARAAALGWLPTHGLILLGGDWPPDLRGKKVAFVPPILYGRGDADTLYPEEQFEQDLKTVQAIGRSATPVRFPGGHEWNSAFSEEVAAYLKKIKTETMNDER